MANRKPKSSPARRKPAAKAAPKTVTIRLPGDTRRQFPAGTEAGAALRDLAEQEGQHPVAARFDNKITSLYRPLNRSGKLEPVYANSTDGNRVMRRGLTFLLVRAVSELFPDLKVYINHSLNGGYYAELNSERYSPGAPVKLTPTDLHRVKERIRQIIASDEPFRREEVMVSEATRMFAKAGMPDKVQLLKYREEGLVSVYRCGSSINHFYGQLPPTTGMIGNFDLVPCEPGFVLRFASAEDPGRLVPYEHQPKLFAVFQEYDRWMRILGLRTVAQFNEIVDTNQLRDYVHIAEALHEKKIAQIADRIAERKPRIIMLSGPSASGKTTSLKRLAVQLRVIGYRPVLVSLDDFFVPRDRTPKDEHGDFDFESFDAIDVPLLQRCVRALLRGEKVRMPRFNFIEGRSKPGDEMHLGEGELLLLEGIHALNTNLLPSIPESLKFKIYASPLTHPNIDDHNRIASSDVRLLRRIVRDFSYRGYSAAATLGRWPSVRRGEHKNIFPYQENADVIFNTSLPYEFTLLKQFALPVVAKVKRTDPVFSEAARLMKFLSYFRDMDASWVPHHSLLREFIGGSSFKY